MPEPLIDAHLHIWDPRRLSYPWLDYFPSLNRVFSITDYQRSVSSYLVEQMVFVQCQCEESLALDEVAWVTEVAHREPRITGIVAWAPLETGSRVRPILRDLSRNKLVKGVRCPIQHAKDPKNFGRAHELHLGIRQLSGLNLSLDLCIDHTQINIAEAIARSCPDVRIIIDHLGKPDIRRHRLQPWADNISALASFPNVWCKISGMITEADWTTWTRADLEPFLRHVLASFGPDRILFGGDWPVVTLAGTLPRWIDMLDELVEDMSKENRAKLLRENARRFYNLPAATPAAV